MLRVSVSVCLCVSNEFLSNYLMHYFSVCVSAYVCVSAGVSLCVSACGSLSN
jgi:hypothetical protein